MRITGETDPGKVTDVFCDMCGESTRVPAGDLQFGTMHASWGKGSAHCGENYKVHLCENCFFAQLAHMKRVRWGSVMFEDEGDSIMRNQAYGRVGQMPDSDGVADR